jgi:hypothetical protein
MRRRGRVALPDGKEFLDENIPCVDSLVHNMPGHPVPALSIEDRPRGRVDSRVPRERAVVVVDGELTRQREHGGVEDLAVDDAEEVVEPGAKPRIAELRCGGEAVHAMSRGPRPERSVGGHHRANLVSRRAEDLRTLEREVALAQDSTGRGRSEHRRRPRYHDPRGARRTGIGTILSAVPLPPGGSAGELRIPDFIVGSPRCFAPESFTSTTRRLLQRWRSASAAMRRPTRACRDSTRGSRRPPRGTYRTDPS